ncbi:MAG: ABC transporter ATP-binding protein [Oscillospiraceae bacterium]|nr:ABC transporter ATP-binding protein [Oscillospiraceae bacterium]MDE6004259.1 ABC transporter ATP-binding protein [Oscillospiraceae bacterium]
MMNFENAIEIQNLTKKYDSFLLDAINFHVPKGSIMGFIGQNGAGKTTTIKALLNIIKFDTGKINILGMDNIQDEIEIKKKIAVVFDELPFQDIFNAKQIARILCDVFPEWDNQVYENYLERFQLPKKKKIGQFSKGMKMKLQIATALSHHAELLIMDEATTGLDPVVRNEILDIFLEYLQDENHSIFMSSHITSDLEKIADSVTFIDKGKILISGYKDEILEQHGMMKCSKKDYQQIDKNDMISARLTDFGAEIMIADKIAMQKKYAGLLLEPTSLEEIMLFYVNRSKKEWS